MPTMIEAWALYCKIILAHSSKRSVSTERGRWLNYIYPRYGSQEISSLTNLDLVLFRTELEQRKKSPQTIYHILSLMRRILRCAQKYNLYCGFIPIFPMPKFDNKRQRFLTRDEAQQLLFHLQLISPLWHDISMLSLQTGLRAGEIFSLQKLNIALDVRLLYIFDCNKNNKKTRVIPLNECAYTILKTHYSSKGYIFKTAEGKQFHEVSSIFRKAVQQCGLNHGVKDRRLKIVFHSLRHTFASWLIQAGIPLGVVGNLLGHSTQAMTERYAHLAPDQMRAAVLHPALNILNSNKKFI